MGTWEHRSVISYALTVTCTDTYLPWVTEMVSIICTPPSHRTKAKHIRSIHF